MHVSAGPQAYLLSMFRVARVMRPKEDPLAAPDDVCWDMIADGIYVDGNATLEAAMPIFEKSSVTFIPVITLVGENEPPELWGALFHVDALKVYNRALAATAAEEHS